jgi:hypothetical protein
VLPLITYAISLRNSATSKIDSIQVRTPAQKRRLIPDDYFRLTSRCFSDISGNSTDQTIGPVYDLVASSECIRPTSKLNHGATEHPNHTSTLATQNFSTVSRKQAISQKLKDKAINGKSETAKRKRQLSVIEHSLSDDSSHEPFIKRIKPNEKTSKRNAFTNSHNFGEAEKLDLTHSNLDLCSAAKPTTTKQISINPSITNLLKDYANNIESDTTALITRHEPGTIQISPQSSQERSLITQLPFSALAESVILGKTPFFSKKPSNSDHNNGMTKGKSGSEDAKICIFSPDSKDPAFKAHVNQCTTRRTISTKGPEILRKSAYASSNTVEKLDLKEKTIFHKRFEIGIKDDTHDAAEVHEGVQNQVPNLVDLSKDIELQYNNDMDQESPTDHNYRNFIEDNPLEKEESISVIIEPTIETSLSNDTEDETITTNDDTIVFTQDNERGAQNCFDNQDPLSPKKINDLESPHSKATAGLVKIEKKALKTPTKSIPKFALITGFPKKPLANKGSGLTRKLPSNCTQTSISFVEKCQAKNLTTKMPSFTIMTPKKTTKTNAKETSPTKGISFTPIYKEKEFTKPLAFTPSTKKMLPSKALSFSLVTKMKDKAPSTFRNKSERSDHLKSPHKLKSARDSDN